MMKKIVVLSGAGMSAESGIQTFRDADGLWEGHDVIEVATPEGFRKDPALVLEFYNQRRKQLKTVRANNGHLALVDLEKKFEVTVITQNVDDLHERAGSTKVIHLHGELRKVRSTKNPSSIKYWEEDCNVGDLCENGHQLRPHIVWFGEAVPKMEEATYYTAEADIIIIIGTSMQVYPAAGLVGLAKNNVPIYYIDPNPKTNYELEQAGNLTVIPQKAGIGVRELVNELMQKKY